MRPAPAEASAETTDVDTIHQSRAGVTMLANLAFTAGAGFAYWLVAAHSYSAAEIGRAGAVASSAMLVVFATNLGLTVAVGRHAGTRHGDDDARFSVAAAATVMSSLVGAVVLFALGPDRVMRAISRPEGWWGEVAFLAIVACLPLAQLADIRLLALRRHRLVRLRAAISAVAKVTAAVLLSRGDGRAGSLALFAGLLAPDAISGLIAGGALALPGARRIVASRRLPPLRAAAEAARVNYLSVLLTQGVAMAVPFIVISHVSDADNANFYLAWSFTQIALLVPQSISWGLHVEGHASPERLAVQVQTALRHAVTMSALAALTSLVLVVAMPAVYGDDYALGGRIAPLLMAGALPFGVTMMALVEARILDDRRAELTIAATHASLVVGGVFVLVNRFGLWGAVIGASAGTALGDAVSAMVRRRRPAWSVDLTHMERAA